MAQTLGGLEFYLVEIYSLEDMSLDQLEVETRKHVRSGDGVLNWGGRLYVAVVGTVSGASKAARRLMAATRKNGLQTKVALVTEPFAPELAGAAGKVIQADVDITARD